MGCDAQKWRFLEYACSQNIYKICGTTSLERQYPVLWNGGFTAQEYSLTIIKTFCYAFLQFLSLCWVTFLCKLEFDLISMVNMLPLSAICSN